MTVLVDTSVWIDYLRDRVPAADALDELLRTREAAITDTVLLELLVGPTDEGRAESLARFLSGFELLNQVSPVDAEVAAALHRACRRAGETPRTKADCLVAAVAIRHGVPVLHADRDFDLIARHSELQVLSP